MKSIGQYTKRERTYYEKEDRSCQRGIKNKPIYALGTI